MRLVQKLKGSQGVRPWLSGGKNFSSRERNQCKGPGAEKRLVCWRNNSKASGLGWSRRGREWKAMRIEITKSRSI